MSTLAQMRTALRRKIGNPDTTSVTNAILDEHINSAYVHLTTRYRHKQGRENSRFNTVAGTSAYTLTGQYAVVFQVWNRTTNTKLTKLGWRQRVDEDLSVSSSTTQGVPLGYETWQDSIILYPVPDAVYAIEAIYKKIPTALSADGDTPVINALWHPGIVFLSRFYYWDDRQDFAKAQQAYNTWRLWMSDIAHDVDEETVDSEDFGVVLPGLRAGIPRGLDFDHGG